VKNLVKLGVPKWLFGLLALCLVVGGGYGVYRQITAAKQEDKNRRVQMAVVERVNLPITITANGVIQPERSINLSPKTSGVLKQLLVKEGDRVQTGEVVAYMDDSNLQGQLTQAKGQLASARANLERAMAGNRSQEIAQAQARVLEAQAALRQAEQNFQQNQQLFGTGAISRREFNSSVAERDRALAQVVQANQGLSLQKAGSRPEDIAQARAEVTRTEGVLQTIQAQISDTIIRAPFSGVITRKFADPGAFVTPTTAGSAVSSATSSSILALASRNQVVAKVAETSIPQIKLGQGATILPDAFPEKFFKGQVIQIAAQSTVEQNVTNFEVKLSLIDPKNLLRSGMNVNVEFNVGTFSNALVIPTVAIVRQEEGTGVLVTGQGDRPSENSESKSPKRKSNFRPIKTGLTVNDKTVVLSGLEAGEKVLLSFPSGERPPSRTPSLMPGMGPRGR
jgi:HlyD family secretion protein